MMPERELDRLTRALERTFAGIYRQRMADMPLLNRRIAVTALGFRRWQDAYLGIMITPWFMNLMLLPAAKDRWQDLEVLGRSRHSFPSGVYEFITGFEEGIGKYQMCSLFSPMQDFADNEAAIDTATAILRELMNPENRDDAEASADDIVAIWHGAEAGAAVSAEAPPDAERADRVGLSERLQQPISRRQLLRASLLTEEPPR